MIRIENVKQIFNTFDPSPFHERDLDSDFEEFVLTVAEEIWSEGKNFKGYQIDIVMDELPSPSQYKEIFHKDASMESVSSAGGADDNSNLKFTDPPFQRSSPLLVPNAVIDEDKAENVSVSDNVSVPSRRIEFGRKRKWSISSYDKAATLSPANAS